MELITMQEMANKLGKVVIQVNTDRVIAFNFKQGDFCGNEHNYENYDKKHKEDVFKDVSNEVVIIDPDDYYRGAKFFPVTSYKLKPLDIVLTPKGGIAIVAEMNRISQEVSLRYIYSKENEYSSWWNPNELKKLNNLALILSEMAIGNFSNNHDTPKIFY